MLSRSVRMVFKLTLQLLGRWNITSRNHSEHLNTLGALQQRIRNEECRVEAMRTWGVLLSGRMNEARVCDENMSEIAANAYEFVTLLDCETLDWQSDLQTFMSCCSRCIA